MKPLPHRFSEKSFRKYENIIAEAVDRFPAALEVMPEHLGLSLETVRGRLKDAMSSLKLNLWKTKVNMTKFLVIEPNMVVSLRPEGRVMVGDKDTVKSLNSIPFDCVSPNDLIDLTGNPEFQQINLLCFLAHHQAFQKQIKLHLSDSQVETLPQTYDIKLVPQTEQGVYLLS